MLTLEGKVLDCFVLFGLVIVAVIGSYALHATFLMSAFLFMGLPSLYLFLRVKPKKRETLYAVLVFGVLYCFLMDYLAELNGAWAWEGSQLLFPHRILGVVSADAILWTSLWVLLLVLFYEHMLDRQNKDIVSKKIWLVIGFGLFCLSVILAFHFISPSHLHITYAYLILGLCTLPPFLYVVLAKPRLLPRLLKAAVYFIPLYFVYELVGRSLGQWDFPGHYIGMVRIVNLTFPLEEFMFWITLSSIVVLGGYEIFIDDGK